MFDPVEDLIDAVESDIEPSVCSDKVGRSFSALGESIGVGSSSRRDTSVDCEAFEFKVWSSMMAVEQTGVPACY